MPPDDENSCAKSTTMSTTRKFFWLLLLMSGFGSSDAEIDLVMPALGRPAVTLGELYDARTQQFKAVTIFNENLHPDFITEIDTPLTDAKYWIVDSKETKLNHLSVDASLKLDIMSGKLTVEGSAKYFSEPKTSALEVEGFLHYKMRTKRRLLNLFYEDLRCYIRVATLQELAANATHIVVGIEYGSDVIVKFTDQTKSSEEKMDIEGKLKLAFSVESVSIAGEAAANITEKNSVSFSNFTLQVYGDMNMDSKLALPKTAQAVGALIGAVPERVEKTKDGLGVPMVITLFPISPLLKLMKVEGIKEALVGNLDESILNDFIQMFDKISHVTQQLNDLLYQMRYYSNCTSGGDITRLENIKNGFSEAALIFRINVRNAMSATRTRTKFNKIVYKPSSTNSKEEESPDDTTKPQVDAGGNDNFDEEDTDDDDDDDDDNDRSGITFRKSKPANKEETSSPEEEDTAEIIRKLREELERVHQLRSDSDSSTTKSVPQTDRLKYPGCIRDVVVDVSDQNPPTTSSPSSAPPDEVKQEDLKAVLKDYKASGEYHVYKVSERLETEFQPILDKIELYKVFQKSGVQYFGRYGSFSNLRFQTVDKIIYAIYMLNTTGADWNNNWELFQNTLKQNFSILAVVDCAFNDSVCVEIKNNGTLNRTVTYQYYAQRLISKDVYASLEKMKGYTSKPIVVSALGNFHKVGDLYSSQGNQFIGRSLLHPGANTSQLRLTREVYNNETMNIVDNRLLEKFEVINVQPLDLRYNILIDPKNLQKSGSTFKEKEGFDPRLTSKTLIHLYNTVQENVLDADETSFDFISIPRLFKGGATHFVQGVIYGGVNSISLSYPMNETERGFDLFPVIENDLRKIKQILIQKSREAAKNQVSSIIVQDCGSDTSSSSNSNCSPRDKAPGTLNQLKSFSETIQPQDLNLQRKYRISIASDIFQSSKSQYQTKDDLIDMLNTFPENKYKGCGGRGQPVAFILYPLVNLQQYFGVIPRIPDNPIEGKGPTPSEYFFDPVTGIYDVKQFQSPEKAKKLTEIFEAFQDAEGQSETLKEYFNGHLEFVTPDVENNFYEVVKNFATEKTRVIRQLNEALNSKNTEDLEKILNNFNTSEIISSMFNLSALPIPKFTALDKFQNPTKKIKWLSKFRQVFPEVNHVGRDNALGKQWTKYEPSDNVYVLFHLLDFAVRDDPLWLDNVNLFRGHLAGKPYNQLVFVDCDFDEPYCKNLTGPVIHLYKNKELISSNVLGEWERVKSRLREKSAIPVQRQTMGRQNVRMGQLYNIRTEQFVGQSILNSESESKILIETLQDVTIHEPIVIESPDLKLKYQAMNVEPEMQLALMVEDIQKEFEFGSGAILHTCANFSKAVLFRIHASSSNLNLSSTAFPRHFNPDSISEKFDPNGPTHFVKGVKLGFNIIVALGHSFVPGDVQFVKDSLLKPRDKIVKISRKPTGKQLPWSDFLSSYSLNANTFVTEDPTSSSTPDSTPATSTTSSTTSIPISTPSPVQGQGQNPGQGQGQNPGQGQGRDSTNFEMNDDFTIYSDLPLNNQHIIQGGSLKHVLNQLGDLIEKSKSTFPQADLWSIRRPSISFELEPLESLQQPLAILTPPYNYSHFNPTSSLDPIVDTYSSYVTALDRTRQTVSILSDPFIVQGMNTESRNKLPRLLKKVSSLSQQFIQQYKKLLEGIKIGEAKEIQLIDKLPDFRAHLTANGDFESFVTEMDEELQKLKLLQYLKMKQSQSKCEYIGWGKNSLDIPTKGVATKYALFIKGSTLNNLTQGEQRIETMEKFFAYLTEGVNPMQKCFIVDCDFAGRADDFPACADNETAPLVYRYVDGEVDSRDYIKEMNLNKTVTQTQVDHQREKIQGLDKKFVQLEKQFEKKNQILDKVSTLSSSTLDSLNNHIIDYNKLNGSVYSTKEFLMGLEPELKELDERVTGQEKFIQNNFTQLQTSIKEIKTNFSHRLDVLMQNVTRISEILLPASCSDAMEFLPSPRSTKLRIYPDGKTKQVDVLCDFETDGGGWTIIQKRSSGPLDEFNRTWDEYSNGFGSLDKNFWLGLDNIHALTKNGDHVLRIELENFDGEKRYAEYYNFSVSDASDSYRLSIRGFSAFSTAGDSITSRSIHSSRLVNGAKFSTVDKDNSNWEDGNCAALFSGGGWWFNNCGLTHLNGPYKEQGASYGIRWTYWKKGDTQYPASLAKTEMKIRKSK